ncbi:inactive pancreatic lipase-related protein 1 [Neodiprion pinetum]|uniref:phospholipase A1 n=1 Tax=Neodiprion lecontei TaxID=441921 RepID=A0A6J0BJG1_NEOLC|nr:inactive pancreatic lipase-related protein 1 [Neodiprion lecontei]XP_046474737.1 inactive pancreatic lipase-related protein 1 [Neodiprion pinetum]XP_046609071.1 inactive pancreatic lipase-related protein 1 [Neodiprion virginianus]
MAISVVRVFITAALVSAVLFVGGVRGQSKALEDLFNNTSCLKGPIVCPNPRIEFYLYTRETQKNPFLIDVLDPHSLDRSKFNNLHPTKVIIHGFGGGRNLAPSTDLRKAYFTRGNYNVIIVDYGSLVREPCLSQVRWGPNFCSQCIAQLVRYLKNHPRGIPVESVHVLGYSVGAHIAGLMANHLPGDKLGRITGLDPTILFYMGGGNRSLDLDDTDAHFVDVIHTGAGILGQWGPTGHADFYVNGGSSQPGCLGTSILQTLSCDHTKVTPYYIESITTEVGFWAAPCANLLSYLIGWCNPAENEYVLMGEDTPSTARGIYYLSTNGKKPYARGLPEKIRATKSRKRSFYRQY